MKTVKILGLVAFQILFLNANAQNYSAQNSADFIRQGISYYEAEKYQSALKEFSKVHRNDTNYAIALYEISLTQVAAKNYEDAIQTCKKGLSEKTAYGESFYTSLGTSYSELTQYDKAVEAYDIGLTQFPKNSSLKYNKAVALLRNKKYKEGLEVLYANLRENPYHANSHLLLGNICASLQLESQAILSYNMYLIMADGNSSFNALKYVDGYVGGVMDGNDDYSGIDFLEQGFESIDELIASKAAINSSYKIPCKHGFPVLKQSHFLFSQLEDLEGGEGFWNEYYVPFFKQLYKDDMFEGFAYFLVRSGVDYNSDIAKYDSKKSSKKTAFTTWYSKKFDDFFAFNLVNGKKMQHHHSDGKLVAIGKYEDNNYLGDWTFYYENGALSRVGSYLAGKQHGTWTSYYSDGTIRDTYTYNKGVIEGPFSKYNIRGVLSEEGNYKEDYYNGPIKFYFSTGGIEKIEEYTKGGINGKLEYFFQNGGKSVEATFKDGELEGELIFYGINGTKTMVKNFEKGKENGMRKSWYLNGSIKTENEYKNGEINGVAKSFYRSGQLESESNYINGQLSGISVTYHENGQKDQLITFDEGGKENGISTTYFDNGEVLSNETFKKGDLVAYEYFDKEGKILSQGKISGKTIDFKRYDHNGFLHSTGTYEKGGKNGLWQYYASGLEVPLSKLLYKDGLKEGKQEVYFANGNIAKEYSCKEGEIQGEYNEYLNGNKKIIVNSGSYKDGEEYGEFVRKNALDIVHNRVYYKDGTQHKWQIYYTEKGKIAEESFFEDGAFFGSVIYDSSGNVRDTLWLTNGTGEYKDMYPNGKPRFIGNYLNGKANGKFTFYHPNGQIHSAGDYVNGKMNGEWLAYFENGKLDYKSMYNYGDQEGIYISYFEDGQKSTESTYKYDEREGLLTRYYENGKVRYTQNYKNGELDGESRYYVPSGDLAIVRYYVEDILISYSYLGADGKLVKPIFITGKDQVVTGYFKNGKKSIEYKMNSNDYVGNFTWYYPSGKTYKISNYENGLLQGKMEGYQENGKTLFTYNYEKDEMHGTCIDYHLNGNKKREFTYFMDDLEGVTYHYDTNGNTISTRHYFNNRYYGGKL